MKSICVLIVLLVFYSAAGKETQAKKPEEEIQLQTLKFRTILETAYKNYADSIDISKISESAFSAMLHELDPYSQYFNSQQYRSVSESNQGSTEGTGLSVFIINDTVTVTSVFPGSPAESSGILPGDKLLFVDGENTYKKPVNDIIDRLNGTEGSFVTIILKRGYSTSLQELRVMRKKYPVSSISSSLVIDGTEAGYIKMNRFSQVSDKEFIEAAMALKKGGMKKLIFDLRGNQGGFIDEACNIADQFIRGGKKITYISGKDSAYYRQYLAKEGQALENVPVIVLIDDQTASASEIIAGALQDLDRGLILGSFSLGKGLVQKYWEFRDSSAFRLTVARYFTPSGRCIQKPFRNDASGALDPSLKLSMDEKAFNNLEEQIRKMGGRKSLDVYKTEKGRTILGGGGIMPDYFVKEDSTSILTQVMKSKGIFLEYAYQYINVNRAGIIKEYADPAGFSREFEVADTMLADFSALSKSKNAWNEKMFQNDKNYIKTYIKANIAHALWGNPGYYAVMLQSDRPVIRALELFPEAEHLVQ